MDPPIWTLLCRVVYFDPSVVVSLWVTEGHHGSYQQVTLKVAPVGDPKDSLGIILSIWTRIFGPVYLDPSIWTCIFRHVFFDLSIWTRLFGPTYLNL